MHEWNDSQPIYRQLRDRVSRYLEVMGNPEQLAAARALKPMHDRTGVRAAASCCSIMSIVTNSPRSAKCAGRA
jgi:hypothetical protein